MPKQTQARDPYFLESASKVSFFFEEKAFDAAGGLAVPKDLAINKIGHGALRLSSRGSWCVCVGGGGGRTARCGCRLRECI
jgi:hypothetical protein